MDPVSNESVPVCQEEDSNMSPQPLIIDESNEVSETSVSVRAAINDEIFCAARIEVTLPSFSFV
ncbi:hypothetical protein GHT06_022854 [Daphnia sinensis]|uniref:Uncharacterized protein n=1 Tax=Daphnia sinensis TaxID=1820382 RepID=A0AAD5KYR6_9CRUS|nr:hypothetical protein GHT06_022854 [Daphnia sinensis]